MPFLKLYAQNNYDGALSFYTSASVADLSARSLNIARLYIFCGDIATAMLSVESFWCFFGSSFYYLSEYPPVVVLAKHTHSFLQI